MTARIDVKKAGRKTGRPLRQVAELSPPKNEANPSSFQDLWQ
jgi:hypothetical protein